MIRLSSCVALLLAASCRPETAAPEPEPAPVAPTAPVVAGGRCDVEALTEAAAEIDAARDAWSPKDGTALAFAPRVADAIRTHCASVLATGLEPSLARVLDPERVELGLPTHAECDDAATLRVCPTIAEVAEEATNRYLEDRPRTVYSGCELDRFHSTISDEDFVDARGQTGGVTMLALRQALIDAGVPDEAAATLTRELVLASGVHPQPPPDIRLPARPLTTARRLRAGFAISLSSSQAWVGSLFGKQRPVELVALPDALAEADPKQPLWLMADRDLAWTRVAETIAQARGAGFRELGLVVLVDELTPWRGVPLEELPRARSGDTVRAALGDRG